MKKFIDTTKRLTKIMPIWVKMSLIIAVVLQFLFFLLGEVDLKTLVSTVFVAVFAFTVYVGIFHLYRHFDEKNFLEFVSVNEGEEE